MLKKRCAVMASVLVACAVMGIVDAVIMPGYAIKSAIKFLLFLLLPLSYRFYDKEFQIKKFFKPKKKGLLLAFAAGLAVYCTILGAFFLLRNLIDFSGLTESLTQTAGVNKSNFLFIAIYISFVNSLLEEFFFRGFAFLNLKRITSVKVAHLFSSIAFAAYHIAMMIGWFPLPITLLALTGLFIGGIIFNKADEKSETIYLSWLIHMCANFAINTVGFILFDT